MCVRRSAAGGARAALLWLALPLLVCPVLTARADDGLKEPAYTIAVHVSSEAPPKEGPEEVRAIKDFVEERARALNAAGGLKGHRIDVRIFDDHRDGARTIANVETALKEPRLIAMLGLPDSTRGAPVLAAIGKTGVPLISELSVETLFAPYPAIYSLTRSAKDEKAAFAEFARDNFKRVAFVGSEEDLYTQAYRQHIEGLSAELPIVASVWLKGEVQDNAGRIAAAVEEIKQSGADLIFFSIVSRQRALFLGELTKAGIALPVFIGRGSIANILSDPSGAGLAYGGALYEIAEGGIANLNNERLEQLMRKQGGLLSERKYSHYAAGYGARYADLVTLVTKAAAEAKDNTVEDMRLAVTRELDSLREGKRIWRGEAQDWSFTAERASAERSILVWRPPGENASVVLAPMQYVRSAQGISRVPVLYVHLDMTRIFSVDSTAKSFEAEFFFTMRSQLPVSGETVEFTNVQTSADTGLPLINIREVHEEGGARPGELMTRIYKVTGRFRFEPDLRKYPFDKQVFSISFQPAKTSEAFLLQPPSDLLREEDAKELKEQQRVDGWRVESHYVGANELIIHTIRGTASGESVVPYYNFNYTWVMRRQVVDYVLRVIVPLSFIMVVAYVAIFIPRSEFQAIMGIQVTALLSAIALYLALSQPDADDATMSDIIFLMAYATISAMIALSVLEVNTAVVRYPALMRTIAFLQVYLVPMASLAVLALVILSASQDRTAFELLSDLWP